MQDGQWPGSERALAERLRADRDGRGMKQSDVARRIGISDAYLGHYETGERQLRYDHLRKWLRVLGRPESWADDWRDWRYEEDYRAFLAKVRPPLTEEQMQAHLVNFRQSLRVRPRA